MTEVEKRWIDQASYEDLLAKVRYEPVRSPWFMGDTGVYMLARFEALKRVTSRIEHTRISKKLGTASARKST